MSQRLRASERHASPSQNAALGARVPLLGAVAELQANSRFPFDSSAWAALVEEQRLLIANAAGVDPSKVKIHVGH